MLLRRLRDGRGAVRSGVNHPYESHAVTASADDGRNLPQPPCERPYLG